MDSRALHPPFVLYLYYVSHISQLCRYLLICKHIIIISKPDPENHQKNIQSIFTKELHHIYIIGVLDGARAIMSDVLVMVMQKQLVGDLNFSEEINLLETEICYMKDTLDLLARCFRYVNHINI
jgi:hypothetical protein